MSNSRNQPVVNWCALGLFSFFSMLLAGRAGASEATGKSPGQDPSNAAEATRVDLAPKLDGTLDDPLWRTATPITDFRQREPFEGQASTEKLKCAFCIRAMPYISASAATILTHLELSRRNCAATSVRIWTTTLRFSSTPTTIVVELMFSRLTRLAHKSMA